MAISKKEFTQYIREFKFKELFNDMGWEKDKTSQSVTVDNVAYSMQGLAEKRGFKILLCQAPNGLIPEYPIRKKIETKVTKLFQEHLIIYVDAKNQDQVWQIVVRQIGKPTKVSETTYRVTQDPELLYQRSAGIIFELDEEEKITIVDVTQRITENFQQNNERVTKQFYDKFSKEHTSFIKFIKGIEENVDKEWYASLMLNRLMFCYFIQKKGFLDNNKDYLLDKLKASQEKKGKNKFYSFYRSFLLTLFHQGLGAPDHSKELKEEIGKVPYLNGGLFEEHELETNNPKIDIDDKAFERIFDFFDQYEWHLDTRHTASGKDINPDVIGYIFEKYINDRAQMGAYYTKEDITDYISKNCVLPFLFDETKRQYSKAFEPGGEVWKQVTNSGDRYIYSAAKHGVEETLPKEISKGIKDVASRTDWNKPAPAEFALPTEIWREVIERRNRYNDAKAIIEGGEIQSLKDFITFNLNISQFVQDVIENTSDIEFLKAFYKALNSVTIIDPTCGSGAFLFAAMNILEPLYEACIVRMRAFVEDEDRVNKEQKATFSHKHKFFREVLESIQSPQHPNLQYFIYKSIILRNLYGVDIMREAVEIAKLRLFLKLVATVDADYRKPNLGLEPLPDIDFNIRAGNTLIGFTTEAELDKMLIETIEGSIAKEEIIEQMELVSMAYKHFKDDQVTIKDYKTLKEDKRELTTRLHSLNKQLNKLLHKQFTSIDFEKWMETHQPFHWFAEFYEIIFEKKGFDIIIGNPPYIQNNKIEYSLEHFKTKDCGNLYPTVIERSVSLCSKNGYKGFIVPVSSISTDGYESLQKILFSRDLYFSSFDDRPSKLFDGLEHIRLTIHITLPTNTNKYYSSRYNKWNSVERPQLFQLLKYGNGNFRVVPNTLPKFSSEIEESIIGKMKNQNKNLFLSQDKLGKNLIYFSRKVGYFLQILDFEPLVLNSKNERRPPSEFKEIKFNSKLNSDCALSLLNSNLFYWFITVFSDCRHLNRREIDFFPVDLDKLAKAKGNQISELVKKLMKDLKKTSVNKVMKFKHDTLTIQCIYPKYAKKTIDNIDLLLAAYYGFNDEELDFIINYDIKYRMGKELEEVD